MTTPDKIAAAIANAVPAPPRNGTFAPPIKREPIPAPSVPPCCGIGIKPSKAAY